MVNENRRSEVLRTVFRAFLDHGPCRREEVICDDLSGNNGTLEYQYRPRDYTRWPGQIRLIIKPSGLCRIELTGKFFPQDSVKENQLARKMRSVQHGLNKKLKRDQRQQGGGGYEKK